MKSFLKFIPVIILALLMMTGEWDLLIAAPIAFFAAVAVAIITEKVKFQECMDSAYDSVKNILPALFILMFAYAMCNVFMSTGVAAAVINLALKIGVNKATCAAVGFISTCVLSIATGTSWGTFAACAPIFLWLGYIVGAPMPWVIAAIAGGSCFGDNIGLISDTTIVSSGIQGVEVSDRVRHQGVWSLLCLVVTAILFFVVGASSATEGVAAANYASTIGIGEFMDGNTGAEAVHLVINGQPVNIPMESMIGLQEERESAVSLLAQIEVGAPAFMVIPLLLVIVLAVMGNSTFICIGLGLIASYVLGLFNTSTGEAATTFYAEAEGDLQLLSAITLAHAGDMVFGGGFANFLRGDVMGGFADAGSWVVVMMMWIAAFGGVMRKMNAFEPIANLIVKISGKLRIMMGCNAVLCLIGNALLADEMAQIVTIGPVIKDVVDEHVQANKEDMYKIHLRNATFGDAMGVFGSQLIPWHCYLSYYAGIILAVFPVITTMGIGVAEKSDLYFLIIGHNIMAWIACGSLIVLTFTGLDALIPLFKMPKEPAVKIKK